MTKRYFVSVMVYEVSFQGDDDEEWDVAEQFNVQSTESLEQATEFAEGIASKYREVTRNGFQRES